jgi:hypothetical protein
MWKGCNNLKSASSSESDSAATAGATILSKVETTQKLQPQSSVAEHRTQDQVKRSNTQTVTLLIFIHSYIA